MLRFVKKEAAPDSPSRADYGERIGAASLMSSAFLPHHRKLVEESSRRILPGEQRELTPRTLCLIEYTGNRVPG